MIVSIDIDLNKRCVECGQTGTINASPICMTCMSRAIEGKPMKTPFGQSYAQRVKDAAALRKRHDHDLA